MPAKFMRRHFKNSLRWYSLWKMNLSRLKIEYEMKTGRAKNVYIQYFNENTFSWWIFLSEYFE